MKFFKGRIRIQSDPTIFAGFELESRSGIWQKRIRTWLNRTGFETLVFGDEIKTFLELYPNEYRV